MIVKRGTLLASCFLSLSAMEAQSQSLFGDGRCAIVAASRSSLPEARDWITRSGFESQARVYRSKNGWFAITVDVVPEVVAPKVIQDRVRAGQIPSDTYCSDGSQYVRKVDWRQAPQVLSTDLRGDFDARPLTVGEKRFLQAGLALGGYYSGLLDGVWGQGSQSSLETYTRQEFGREPKNSDAALVGVGFLLGIDEDGWKQEIMEGLAIGVLLPVNKMRITNSEGAYKNWEHSEKDLILMANDLDGDRVMELHGYIEDHAPNSNEIYRVRDDDRWVTSVRTSGFTYYGRSDLIEGTWSTIFVTGDADSQNHLNLIVSSISRQRFENFIPDENGVLMQNMISLMDELSAAPDVTEVPGEVGVSREPQRNSEAPEESQGGATGTGFVINDEGVLLTNAHVVEDCSSISVNGHEASLTASSNTFDLAAVSVRGTLLGEPLRFASGSVGLNADITIAGYPLHGLLGGLNVSRGSISSLKGLHGDETNLQISAPVQPGNSGGPAVDRFGNVVGVVVSKLDAVEIADLTGDIAQNVNFAVRGDLAKVFLSSNNIKFFEANAGPSLGGEELAQRLQASTHLIECFN